MAQGKIRVLVVDDSVVIRHLLMQALREEADIEVVGAEPNGVAALARIPELQPDVVTLDIEMPEMDGLRLRQIRKRHPQLRTIMFSTLTTRGASATFEALALGADDYVAKASTPGARSVAGEPAERTGSENQAVLRADHGPAPGLPPLPAPAVRPAARAAGRKRAARFQILAIGVSTGGPQALARLIPELPAGLRLPILLVQHMPAVFTRLLAERLEALSSLHIVEAADGMEIARERSGSHRAIFTCACAAPAILWTPPWIRPTRKLLPPGGRRAVSLARRELRDSHALRCPHRHGLRRVARHAGH